MNQPPTIITPSALAPAYTCNFCRRTLTLQGPVIVGESTDQKMLRTLGMLAEHLGKEHQDKLATVMLSGQQFAGWLMGEQFTHNDANLATHSNEIRLLTRRHTCRVRISDEKIEQQVRANMDKLDTPEAVIQLMKTMRDALEEVPPPTVQ